MVSGINWLDKSLEWGWTVLLAAIGYVMHAIHTNQKDIAELKLHVSDNYVKKTDFHTAVEDLKSDIRAGNDRIMEVLLNQNKRR